MPARRRLRAALRARRSRAGLRAAIYFEYVGKTGLTVFGGVTGRRYRFHASGTVVAVDPRDGPGLARLPMLRPVRRS